MRRLTINIVVIILVGAIILYSGKLLNVFGNWEDSATKMETRVFSLMCYLGFIIGLYALNNQCRTPDLRNVTLRFEDGSSHDFIMSSGDINKFVNVSLKLYFNVTPPKTGKVTEITTKRLSWAYNWWSTPNSEESNNWRGAKIYEWNKDQTLWKSPN